MQTTNDYSKINFLYYNRKVDETNKRKLMQSMRDLGFLIPVILTKDMFVIDGQNRVKAAEELKIDIKYIQLEIKSDDKKLPAIVSRLNTTSRNWTSQDYLNLYVNLGYENYIAFKVCIEENKITLSAGLWLHGSAKNQVSFRNGLFKFDNGELEMFNIRLKYLNDIRYYEDRYTDIANDNRFIQAITRLITANHGSQEYNHDTMMTKLSKMPTRIGKRAQTRDYMEDLFFIYNYGTKKRILVA